MFKGNQNPATRYCAPLRCGYMQKGISRLLDEISKLTLTPQNVHYHLRKACLTMKNPEFDEDTLIICPPDVGQQLTDVHKYYLKCFNVNY